MPSQTIAHIFLRNRYPALLGGFSIAMLMFLGLYLSATPQWEARGVIRLGQVPVHVPTDVKIEMVVVMHPSEAMEIMRQPSFLQEIHKTEGKNLVTTQEPLRVRLLPAGHVEVKIRGASRELAAQYLDGAIKKLKSSNDKLFERRVAVITDELERINRQLHAYQVVQGRSAALLENAVKGTLPLTDLLLLNLLTQQGERIDRLTEYKAVLEDRVDPLNSFPTNFLGSIDVSDSPVSPNKLIYAILSLFSGLLVAVAIVFILYLRNRVSELGRQN